MGRAKYGGCGGGWRVGVLVLGCMLNDVPGKLFKGMRLIGESGEEEGDGSDRGDESVVDSVVVGDESADSDACVDVLS